MKDAPRVITERTPRIYKRTRTRGGYAYVPLPSPLLRLSALPRSRTYDLLIRETRRE